MKFPTVAEAFGPHFFNAPKPLTMAYTSLSALEPALYSLPEPATTGPGSLRASPPPPASAATATYPTMTSLPGSAVRPSIDQDVSMRARRHATSAKMLSCQQPDPPAAADAAVPRSATANVAGPLAAAPPTPPRTSETPPPQQQQHLQRPSLPQASRQSLHYDREVNRARRSCRPSIDAAAGATMLFTSPATAEYRNAPLEPPRPQMAALYEVPGCIPPPLQPRPELSIPMSIPGVPAPAAAAAPEQLNEWSFGDNLQRARLLARYAAMAAAEEMRYDPGPPGSLTSLGSDSDGGGGGSGGGSASRKTRGAWKLFSTLLGGSSRGVGSRAASGMFQRWQDATTGRRRRSSSCVSGSAGGGGSGSGGDMTAEEKPSTPVVVRSRDSRRLLRVQRTRVGIDRDGQKSQTQQQQQQQAGGRISAPAFTVEYQQQQQQQQQKLVQQVFACNSAPVATAQCPGGSRTAGNDGDDDDDDEDEVNAAIIAAATAFVAFTEVESLP